MKFGVHFLSLKLSILGKGNDVVDAGIVGILDSVTAALINDPKKRFSYAETSFFEKWWQIKNETIRQQVKTLVNEGRLEFVGGGWVQNDEAATDYVAIIDQMTVGHQFLRETFGRCAVPKVAWQIDTFGHSRENCALMSQVCICKTFHLSIESNEIYCGKAKAIGGCFTLV
ncbi:unnamed protein product [Soboliphyme baturini]|uniref:Glyco_hydro_38N domain-containing protein n=1 Tax=Soboliphyme baturini TaxID=241478 RepID=A0A183IAJ9_9BILA|nr:unnamed protein product [Soboliphyme baturini]